jgi:chemotaxis protein MotB
MEKDKLNENLSSVKSQLSTTEMEVKKVQSAVDDKQSQLDAMRGEMKSAFSTMEEAVSMSQAEIYRSNERIKVIEDNLYLDLHDQLDFKTGSNRINPEDTETLEELAKMLNENPNLNLVIEGHTDDRPISNDKYSDNWDLSVARSTQIVRKLIDLGVNPEQLIAAGRSEYLPADTTDPESTETRAANRRVEVMLLPNIGKLYRMQKGN